MDCFKPKRRWVFSRHCRAFKWAHNGLMNVMVGILKFERHLVGLVSFFLGFYLNRMRFTPIIAKYC